MGRIFLTTFSVVAVACMAAGATETSLVLSKKQSTSPEPTVMVTTKPVAKPATTPATTTKTTTTPTTSTVPAPPKVTAPAPVVTPTEPTAAVNGYVHMRSQPSTAAAIVTDLYQGDSVTYTAVDSGDWQAVTYQGQAGYVYKAYLNY